MYEHGFKIEMLAEPAGLPPPEGHHLRQRAYAAGGRRQTVVWMWRFVCMPPAKRQGTQARRRLGSDIRL
jgi:hypothetical protein